VYRYTGFPGAILYSGWQVAGYDKLNFTGRVTRLVVAVPLAESDLGEWERDGSGVFFYNRQGNLCSNDVLLDERCLGVREALNHGTRNIMSFVNNSQPEGRSTPSWLDHERQSDFIY
jgi:hypothetical protein